MTVRELLEKLKQFDPDLLVCLGDWNESYADPCSTAVECMRVTTGLYYDGGDFTSHEGTFLEIGYKAAIFKEDSDE